MISAEDGMGGRDSAAEQELLAYICRKQVRFAVLQRDWRDPSHGDLDIVASKADWPRLTEILSQYSASTGAPIVKAYEIEHGVICIVMLTQLGTLYLDVSIAGACRKIFGLPLEAALSAAETFEGVPVLSESDYRLYKSTKRAFKKSPLRKLLKKTRNLPVIIRRLWETSFTLRGVAFYAPYIDNRSILMSASVRQRALTYLQTVLKARYS